jgi:hypothetical protein
VKAVGPEVHQGQTLRLAAWEIIIWSVLFFYIVSPFHPYLWSIFPGMHEGFRAATVEFFGTELYFLNYTMLAALVLSLLAVAFRAWQARAVSGVPVMAILFATLFASLYLLDFFVSRAPVYPYAKLSIVLLPLVIWLFVLLFADQQSALRLLKVTALFIVIQSIYGITYYVTGTEQFYTPRFGARTGGTLESPNSLYPVALMGVPSCGAWRGVPARTGRQGCGTQAWELLSCFDIDLHSNGLACSGSHLALARLSSALWHFHHSSQAYRCASQYRASYRNGLRQDKRELPR